jgi:arylsulfatase
MNREVHVRFWESAGLRCPAPLNSNELISGLDWFPTLLAAAGDTNVKDLLLKGGSVGNKTFKVHLDGYNQLPYLTGQQEHGARSEFYYFNDDGELVAMRFDFMQAGATSKTAWKIVFCEQRAPGQLEIWANPFTCLRLPRIFNLRMDPYEHAQISGTGYEAWWTDNAYITAEGVRRAAGFLQTFVEYPPSQTPGSFSIEGISDQVKKKIAQLQSQAGNRQ